MLNESNIPPALLARARVWYDRQIANLERKHGDQWPDHREWLDDYLNAELLDLIGQVEAQHGV